MLAHHHGQVWNAAERARALGVAGSTVRRYLDLRDHHSRRSRTPPKARRLPGRVRAAGGMRQIGALPGECFFWATHACAKLDLLVIRGPRRLGLEIKRTTSPSATRSTHAALEALNLERLQVIHAGEHTFPLRDRTRAVAFGRLGQDLETAR